MVHHNAGHKKKRGENTALEVKLDMEWYVEDPDEVYRHQDEPQWDTELGPFFAGDAQLPCRDDVWDISGDQHSTGDEQAHENRLNLS